MPNFLIADDHTIVLIGTQHLLQEQFPGAGSCLVENFDDAVAAVQRQRFDLVLLDINLPGGNRLGMIESLRLRQPDLKILMFSAFEETQYAAPYLKAGADGYIWKRCGRQELINAVAAVLQHKKYLSPQMQQVYLEKMLHDSDPFLKIIDRLSRKEREVMNLLISGLSTNDIAATLSISAPAVSSSKSKIFGKLGVSNTLELKELLANICPCL